MRIAVCQYLPTQSLQNNLDNAFKALEESAKAGADLVAFGEWFIGIMPHRNGDDIFRKIARKCHELQINTVTGNVPSVNSAGHIEQRTAVIDSSGRIISVQKKVNPYQMEADSVSCGRSIYETEISIGRLVVLNGLDAIDPFILEKLGELDLNLLVLQVNPSSTLEIESLKELSIALSTNCSDAVIVPSQGAIRQGAGGAFVAYEGIILEEGYSESDIVIATVLSESFIGFKSLREPFAIPDLLKQKFMSEVGNWKEAA